MTVCFTLPERMIQLRQSGPDNFAVQYGKQIDERLTYDAACTALGAAIMHSLACEDAIDNRDRKAAPLIAARRFSAAFPRLTTPTR